MASLQAYQSHGIRYYRIVESFRKDGKPHIRVLAHLGRVEDILNAHQQERNGLQVGSVSAGAVTGLFHLARELDVVGKINESLREKAGSVQTRDGLTVGESLLAGIIGRACAPRVCRLGTDNVFARADGVCGVASDQSTFLGSDAGRAGRDLGRD